LLADFPDRAQAGFAGTQNLEPHQKLKDLLALGASGYAVNVSHWAPSSEYNAL
jgi:hypothetical protein